MPRIRLAPTLFLVARFGSIDMRASPSAPRASDRHATDTPKQAQLVDVTDACNG
jgi:hypothetical protein